MASIHGFVDCPECGWSVGPGLMACPLCRTALDRPGSEDAAPPDGHEAPVPDGTDAAPSGERADGEETAGPADSGPPTELPVATAPVLDHEPPPPDAPSPPDEATALSNEPATPFPPVPPEVVKTPRTQVEDTRFDEAAIEAAPGPTGPIGLGVFGQLADRLNEFTDWMNRITGQPTTADRDRSSTDADDAGP